jgi:hypothetical protein
MKKLLSYFPVIALLLSLQCSRPTQISGGGDDVVTGYLYYQNGKAAANCQVTAVDTNMVPIAGQSYSTTTDSLGRFFLDTVPLGAYNIYGKKDSLGSYLESVALGRNRNGTGLLYDTLRPTGSLSGVVRLSATPDSRITLIMVIGSTMITGPSDSSGDFSFTGLPQGTYRFRFLTIDSQYEVLDTTFSVLSGKNTDVGLIELTSLIASDTILMPVQKKR